MRLRGLLALALLTVLVPRPASAAENPSQPDLTERVATRADVLAGRASPPQTFALMKASVEAAGGDAVQATAEEALGGHSYPLLSVDLDGDGEQETLHEQSSDRTHVTAVDDGNVLWRVRLPKNAFTTGTLTGDFAAGNGDEVVIFVYRWRADRFVFVEVGLAGQLWRFLLETAWFDLNGAVQADDDPQSELAITVFEESTAVRTYDGEDGWMLGELHPTLEDRTPLEPRTEAFVTDGPGDGPDEAVFLSDLSVALHAERRRLTDGQQTAYKVLPVTDQPLLQQGPDFTGDGRRDGFMSYWSPFGTVGVFDPATLSVAWTRTLETGSDEVYSYFIPFQAGDANGDGGQDLCVEFHEWLYDDAGERLLESTSRFGCYTGTAGIALWKASISTSSPENGWAYTYASSSSDLTGDGVIDPVLEAASMSCPEPPEEYTSCETSYEGTAYSGRDGSEIWSLEIPYSWDAPYQLTAANLDGVPGDDAMRSDTAPDSDTAFAIFNGATLHIAWFGDIDANSPESFAAWALDPDLDGDGTPEALVTAQSYVGIGDPICETWDGQEFCWYEDYEAHTFVAAFEPGGQRLWQLAL